MQRLLVDLNFTKTSKFKKKTTLLTDLKCTVFRQPVTSNPELFFALLNNHSAFFCSLIKISKERD